MPYIPSDDRPILDEKIDALAEEIASKLVEMNGDAQVSTRYKQQLESICDTLYQLEAVSDVKPMTIAEKLACGIFDVAKKYAYRGAWLGDLNYSITRLIQIVPHKMLEKERWREELRYWIYAQTAGALERCALSINKKYANETTNEWVIDGLVGVLIDVKDEYKRRVSTAYEAVQIRKSGDCFTAPCRTELIDVKDENGDIVGYQEVMKDFRVVKAKSGSNLDTTP